MNILVACDSFKGSLTAVEACTIIAATLGRIHPGWNLRICPLADGGEGTAELLTGAAQGCWRDVGDVMGPLPGMRMTASYGWVAPSATAIVEMARASGLVLLDAAHRRPLETTTYGTGQLLQAAVRQGARHILLTLGGSATVDGGTGAARALGWRFLDAMGQPVPLGGGSLSTLRRIVPPVNRLPEVTVLCDVVNPLCGAQGAARVFAPQKGATPAQVEMLEQGLAHLAELIQEQLGMNVAVIAGGGAAGGFGAGAVAFLGGRLRGGIAVVMERLRFEQELRSADWVITGEGCLDPTSLHGKVVSGVLERARRFGVPVAVLAGRLQLNAKECTRAGVRHALSVTPEDMPLDEAFARAAELLSCAAERLAARLHPPSRT
ncbi:glycerate kinase [Syntrophotalea acetylenica]|uniref:glycerate kinase family protein n=1 Tax=Syntrophotalea acetylenica TaxID=29542 RepID=UPI002A366E4E|nr:glycerate kinase [Syntrophotalea acetylenica]MDY0262813.1 glycerate kinase [Syntrophotalea acetylenica]